MPSEKTGRQGQNHRPENEYERDQQDDVYPVHTVKPPHQTQLLACLRNSILRGEMRDLGHRFVKIRSRFFSDKLDSSWERPSEHCQIGKVVSETAKSRSQYTNCVHMPLSSKIPTTMSMMPPTI